METLAIQEEKNQKGTENIVYST